MIAAVLRRYSKSQSRRHLYDWLQDALRDCAAAGRTRVLNVGSGGEIGKILAAAGLQTVSIDFDPERKPDFVMDVQDLSGFAEGEFDAVCLMEVLEHVPNPQRAADEIRRVLKPGGVLIGSTPFILGIHDQPFDFYRYTKFGLRHLFRDYEEVSLRERNSYFEAVSVLCLRVFNIGSDASIRRAVWLSPVILTVSLLLRLLSCVLSRDDAVTGYFFIYRKTAAAQQVAG